MVQRAHPYSRCGHRYQNARAFRTLAPVSISRLILFLLLLPMLATASHATASPVTASQKNAGTVQITGEAGPFNLDNQYYYLLDESHQLSIDDVMHSVGHDSWTLKNSGNLEWKYSDAAHWISFDLNARIAVPADYVLEIVSPFADRIDFYHIKYDQFHDPYIYNYAAGGDKVPREEKYLNSRNPVFPITLEPGSRNTVIMRVDTTSALILPMNLMEEGNYRELEEKAQAFFGLLFGFMLVMAIYNSVIWLFLRERTFLYYVMYVLFAMGYQMALAGFGTHYVWGSSSWFTENSVTFMACGAFMFGGLFVMDFLSLKTSAPRLYRIAWVMVGIFAGFLLLSLFIPESFLVPILQPLGLVASALVMYAGIYLWRQGSVWAKYLTISWGVLLVGTFTYTLMLLGVIERNPVTEYLQCAGFAIEVSLLSIAMAARMNRERQARRFAMETALDLAHRVNTANQEKLLIQRQANLELEEKVNRKTRELRQAMEELSQANRQLEEISIRDQLTGLYNRRYFDEYFPTQYRNCSLMGKPISVLVIDIDYFKKINDVHGHLAGDECLKTIAKVITATDQREDDKIIRFGGEEFIIVLPNTNTEGANSVAERMRQTVEKTLFVTNGKRIPLTISVGVAALVPNSSQPPESILIKADSALYEAKRSGRNCVKIASA
ncbi:MAG: diguanylate cyclase [Ketobacteraceae bacterium]|nr:diguanylate cyclase [Ketobacteraceae bacterium]